MKRSKPWPDSIRYVPTVAPILMWPRSRIVIRASNASGERYIQSCLCRSFYLCVCTAIWKLYLMIPVRRKLQTRLYSVRSLHPDNFGEGYHVRKGPTVKMYHTTVVSSHPATDKILSLWFDTFQYPPRHRRLHMILRCSRSLPLISIFRLFKFSRSALINVRPLIEAWSETPWNKVPTSLTDQVCVATPSSGVFSRDGDPYKYIVIKSNGRLIPLGDSPSMFPSALLFLACAVCVLAQDFVVPTSWRVEWFYLSTSINIWLDGVFPIKEPISNKSFVERALLAETVLNTITPQINYTSGQNECTSPNCSSHYLQSATSQISEQFCISTKMPIFSPQSLS